MSQHYSPVFSELDLEAAKARAYNEGYKTGVSDAEAMAAKPAEPMVRVLRLLEYIGSRSQVEAQIARSIHGEKIVCKGLLVIRATTLGLFPDTLSVEPFQKEGS